MKALAKRLTYLEAKSRVSELDGVSDEEIVRRIGLLLDQIEAIDVDGGAKLRAAFDAGDWSDLFKLFEVMKCEA